MISTEVLLSMAGDSFPFFFLWQVLESEDFLEVAISNSEQLHRPTKV